MERVSDINEIQHPSVKAIFKEYNVETGLELHHDSDLPARAGLGSSSSFTVGLINALSGLNGKNIKKKSLATEAIRIEQEIICENVGSQDQIWASYGGINRIEFNNDGAFNVFPLILSKNRMSELCNHLILIFTGFSRIASNVAANQIKNIHKNTETLHKMVKLAEIAEDILCDNDVSILELGTLLNESWSYKRMLSSVITNNSIDLIYNNAIDAGAIGGKLLGAGGGGFMLFFVEPQKREKLKKRLSNFISVDVEPDFSGSQVIFYS
jgi:D-glycero-alpha-D-manno-heptose-7-phosphate kinase